ncbi:hypothetical protein ACX0G7_10635 [Flavitalea antarctica]
MSQKSTPTIKATRFSLVNIQPILSSLMISSDSNKVGEQPIDPDKVYIYEGKKYGQPKFRIKTLPATELRPQSRAFAFDKDEATGKITLRCTIEAYREEADVYPLTIKKPQISLSFEAGGKKVEKQLSITGSPIMDAVNILQDLHAQTEIQWDEIKDLIVALKDANKMATFTLTVTAELWWQKPVAKPEFINTGIVPPHIIFDASLVQKVATPVVAQDRSASLKAGAVPVFRKTVIHPGVVTVVKPKPAPVQPAPQTPPAKPEPPQFTDPQKIDLRKIITNSYTKDDTDVFGPLSDEFEVKGLNWQIVNILKAGKDYTIAYRPTVQTDVFYFLPQVFRIKAKEQNGEPKMSINMLPGPDGKPESYRINIAITLIPQYNPKAKKDLYIELNRITKGVTKFCELRLGGFKSVKFVLNPAYAGENAVLRGKIPDSIESIDPVNGFTLTVDCSLESFDYFKREVSEGMIIGDIFFDLISGSEGAEVVSQQRIPVELNIRELAGIPVEIKPDFERTADVTRIKGFTFNNINEFPITIKGADLTLLSTIEDTVYEADYQIGVQENTWPTNLESKASKTVMLNDQEVDAIEDRFWTELICEPEKISINSNANEVLNKVIDYATGDPQIWHLEVSCPLFERWNDLDEATLAPYKQISHITVEIKNEEGNTFSVKLDKTKPVATLDMARSIRQILQSQQLTGRKYKYRVGTVYIINPTHFTDWLDPESTASDFLSVIPQKLAL